MTMRRMFTLVCDDCGNDDEVYGWYAAGVRDEAKADGWRRIKGKDICPACLTKEEQP